MRVWWLLLAGCSGGSAQILEDPTDSSTPVPVTPPATPVPLQACAEGAFLEGTLQTQVPDCETHEAIHAFAGAGGSLIAITLAGVETQASMRIETVYGELLSEAVVVDGGSITVELPWSGEFLVRTQADVGSLSLTRSCSLGCDRPYTRYPLFFFHGMAGTDSFLTLLDYWFEIIDALDDDGIEVGTAAVDPFQVSNLRAAQWADHLDDFFNDGRHRRVNLIGHSQGGLDARYVASQLDPDRRVASVLTIGTPHHGVAMMGPAEDVLAFGFTSAVVDAAIDALVPLWGVDDDQDIVGQMQAFHPDRMAEFNLAVPDRTDVYYASWGGRTCQALDLLCQLGNNGEIVTGVLAATHAIQQVMEGDNDGLVSVTSARWGVDYGVISGDHLDEVGLLGGPITSRGFDPVPFYRNEVERFRLLGL